MRKSKTVAKGVLMCLVVSLIVSIGFFASEAQAKTKLTAMVWGSTEGLEQNIQAIFNVYPELAEEMEIEVVVGGTSDFEVAEKFRLALAAGEDMPDIIQFNWTQIPEFGSAGVLTDLTKATEPYMAQLPSGVQAAMFWDGKVVAYPNQIKTKLFFYRKDMFAEAGIDPTQWKTLDDFIAAGKQFHEKFPESYIWNWGKQSLHYDMFMMVQAFGGRFNDEDGNYVVGTDPGMRQTFETLHKIKHAGIVADIIAWTPDWEKGFVDGVIAGQLLKSWFQLFLPKYAPDQAGKWEVTLWPEDLRPGGNASVYVVPAAAKHKEEAIKFLNAFRLDKEGSIAVYETIKVTPITEEGFNDPRVQEPHPFFGSGLLEAYVESLKTAEMFPFSPKASLERAIIQQYLDKYMNDELSLDDALAGAQKDLDSQLENAFD